MNVSKTIYSTEKSEYMPVFTPDVVYKTTDRRELRLSIVSPIGPDLPQERIETPVTRKFAAWHKDERPAEKPAAPRFPLIICIPGSGWSGAEGYSFVPRMVDLAKRGFVCAGVSYRGTYKDNVTHPAAAQDARDALDFMLAHAAEFHVDISRVGAMGDSSGGNTAAFLSYSKDSGVKACCCVYGPVDAVNLLADRRAQGMRLRPGEDEENLPFECMEIWQEEYKKDPQKYLKEASPLYLVDKRPDLAKLLFIQGDRDPIIPMAQGLRFCDRVRECGGDAEFVKIAGGGHGNGCWGSGTMDTIIKFFEAYL